MILGKMLVEQILNFELRGLGLPGCTVIVHVLMNSCNWVPLWQNKNLQGKFSNELFFAAENIYC